MRVNALILILGSAAAISGCASASKTYMPNGRDGYSINCSGAARNWGMCYEKAGEICGTKGYEVLRKDEGRGAIASMNSSGYSSSGFAGTTHARSMLIQCRE